MHKQISVAHHAGQGACWCVVCLSCRSGWFSEQVTERQDDPVGKICRLCFMLKLLTTMDVQSGRSVLLKRQGVCCSCNCSLEIREMVVVYSKSTYSVLVVLSLVEMEASGIPFHPSTAMHQAGKAIRSFIWSLEETEITNKYVEKVLQLHWLHSHAIGWSHKSGIP